MLATAHRWIGCLLHCLRCRDLAANNLEDAEQNLNRAASIAKLALGSTHALTADIYDMLGDTLLQMDEPEKAESCVQIIFSPNHG